MEILPSFISECEALMRKNGRKETSWFEVGLTKAIEQLHELEKTGNNGLDARVAVAWRNVGEKEYGLRYHKDLAPIEHRIASSILTLTGHVKGKGKRFSMKKGLRVAAGALLGGSLLAASGALVAPIVGTALAATAAGASTGAFLSSSMGIGVVAGVFGAFGANRAAWKMMKREGGLKEFFFIPIKSKVAGDIAVDVNGQALENALVDEQSEEIESTERLHCILGISGWIQKEKIEDLGNFWATAIHAAHESERWALVFDRKVLENYGNALRKFVIDQGLQSVALHAAVIAGGHVMMAAATPPAIALMLQDVLDSPFAVAKERAKLAGAELARAIHARAFGNRPISLVGFGFGSTAIFKCLQCLAEEKGNTEGLIQDVVLFGSPIKAPAETWSATTRIVAGRYVNCYCSKDYVLSSLLRLSTKRHPTAGTQPLNVPGIVDKQIHSTAYEIGTIPGLINFHLKDVLYDELPTAASPPT